MRRYLPLTLTALMLSGQALAAERNEVTTLETESTQVDNFSVGHSSTVENRISGSFTNFAGSPDNSAALTSGLRQGTPINLTSTAPDGTVTITSFTPATGPMGYGNVRISMALAQQQLATYGITNPTPEQLAASLNGGQITYIGPNGLPTTTTLNGVLAQRASGAGWGQIAQTNGTKLGPVISGLKTTHAAGTTVTTAGGTGTVSHPVSGSVSSSAVNHSAGHAYGQGIVTAFGTSPEGVVSSNPGKGHAYGVTTKVSSPVSTASGTGAASSGISTAHGSGSTHGQGHAYGKN